MKKTLSFVLVVSLLAMTCTTAFADAANPFSIFGTDDRKIVSSTSGSNYSICKIYIEYSSAFAVIFGKIFNFDCIHQ